MPVSTSPAAPRVAVLADSDTRWKWGALTAHRIAPGMRLDGFLLRGRATPTARQLDEVGIRADSLREVTTAGFLRAVTTGGYDVVVLACVGGAVQAMLHGLRRAFAEAGTATGPVPGTGTVPETGAGTAPTAEPGGPRGADPSPKPVSATATGEPVAAEPRAGRRPVIVTGYVGVVYEKLADGLLLRHGADVVLANSRHDAERFRAVYAGVRAGTGSVVEAALPFLGGAPYREPAAGERPYTVCFAVQPSVPADRAGRDHLLRRAAGHARRHPEREVLIKLRSKPGEHTTHIEELPYQKLVNRLPGGLPINCRLVYGHMGEVLDRTDLLVTVSSTAALEALHRRIPTAVLTDLGIREALGNHHFLGSGCLASWDELDEGHRPEPDPDWLARQGVAAEGGYERAFDAARERIAKLLDRPALPPVTPYYTTVTAPGYLPGILARYGLDSGGAPTGAGSGAEAADARGMRQVVRGAVREAARGAYRHGVQRVAPVIRRLGEL
ncbi:DUF6716 putative glycosyltransferase [Streptomyces zingiberis]|uniref:Uncharacterized protein n=1 Tax=Streptomyces zingiberis TaxID=2053010 RepID=A0ABX1BY39_9ACTN|nr:DUF6716 putative glycosyltransferase [Streptomyces zingiberis]NJQ00637.1 hypothetical protein [Streptomyces zingiberis]